MMMSLATMMLAGCDDPNYNGESQEEGKLNAAAGDTFNEEEGKRIARERVLDKYHGDLNAALCAYLQDAREIVARLENYMLKHNIDYSSALTEDEIKWSKLSGKKEG